MYTFRTNSVREVYAFCLHPCMFRFSIFLNNRHLHGSNRCTLLPRHSVRLCVPEFEPKNNLMETLMTDRLIDSLAKAVREKKELTETELSSAYTEFMNRLQSITDGGLPIIVKLRQLRRLELELETYRHGSYPALEGLADIYLTKAAALVRMETDLLHFMAEHPGTHAAPSPADEKTKRHPALHWKGSLANLMELIASLDYSALVTDGQGNRQSFAALVAAFETLFNVTLPKPYDLRADLARRKKNLSVLLPKLRETYEKNIVNCGIDRR